MAPEGSADPGVPWPSLLVFRDRRTRLKKGVAPQWLVVQRKPLKPVAEEKFVSPRTKISSGGFQGRWPGICGGTGSLIVWVGLSFDDKSIKQQWTSKSLSLADQIKFSFLPPPPCFWSLLLLTVSAYLPSRLFSDAPTLLHFVVWMPYSCQTPQFELPSSYPILSVFLQTSHFPTISFPFAIADSHFQSQIFSYQTPTGIVSLFSSMLPLGPYNLLSFSLVCTLCLFPLHGQWHHIWQASGSPQTRSACFNWTDIHWAPNMYETHTAAAAAAKSLQLCPTLCDPMDGSPSGSPVPGILQARTLEWVAMSFSNAWKWKVKVKSLSHVRLLATPRTAAHQAPPSMGFSRQEYWSGVPLPSPLFYHRWTQNT